MNPELLEDLKGGKETFWPNSLLKSVHSLKRIIAEEIKEAEDRLLRFAPFLRTVFPETEKTNGIIESPIRHIGVYTVTDQNLFRMLALLHRSESISLEPSALAGFSHSSSIKSWNPIGVGNRWGFGAGIDNGRIY